MYTIPYRQAYKKNEWEGLGIELIIELTVQNSNTAVHGHTTCVGSCQQHVLNVSCGDGLVTSLTICTGM